MSKTSKRTSKTTAPATVEGATVEGITSEAPATVEQPQQKQRDEGAEGFALALATLEAHPARAKSDIAVCFKPSSKHYFDRKTYDAGIALGVDWSVALKLPQKQVKRLTQLVNAVSSGVVGMLDATHARALIAMRLAGSFNLTTDAVTALAAGVYRDGINTRGVGVSQVRAMFARSHGLSTVQTKISNSLGANGLYQVTGMTYGQPGKQNREFALNEEHPMVVAFFDLINRATVGQIEALAGEGEGA